MAIKLFRVIVPVTGIDAAAKFYAHLLDLPGQRVSGGRHYFNCGGTILACFDPRGDGDDWDAKPNPDHVYFAVDDLEATYEHAKTAGCKQLEEQIKTRPWGERSFYATDPFGNKLCFVDERTTFTGSPEQMEEMRKRFMPR
jgi:predicted enzyme related to lactoylglutathione lyase